MSYILPIRNLLVLAILMIGNNLHAQLPASEIVENSDFYDSGGIPILEQMAFDVIFYDLDLTIDAAEKSIAGTLNMTASVKSPLKRVVLHLDTLLHVSEIKLLEPSEIILSWKRDHGLLIADLPAELKTGESFTVSVSYSGHPLAVQNAKRRSWSDGFYFEETPDNKPWIGNVSVLNGADIWFPCKDHPSDEADSTALNITVNAALTVATNGVLRNVSEPESDKKTFHWMISNPINNYAISLNIAPYKAIETVYTSTSGDKFPFILWVIPEHYDLGKAQFENFQKDMRFLEETVGPYPFRAEKYGIAETYYFGMETQSIIAYGSDFTLNEYGFDYLHFHELAHEWFANMVTAVDWKHWWIHESFATYMEPLYAEKLGGAEAYSKYMEKLFDGAANKAPIVLSNQYVSAREGYIGDVYAKGATILHTLRSMVGKEKMIEILRRMAYPTVEMESVTDGSQTRFATTEDFQKTAETYYGADLSWFFNTYLLHADIPVLSVTSMDNTVMLEWQTSDPSTFILPVEISLNGEFKTIAMPNGKASFETNGKPYEIDPRHLTLKTII